MAESSTKKTDLTLYGDLFSQPVRAVYWLLKMKNIPFNFVEVGLFNTKAGMDRFSPEYRKINSKSRVPSLVDASPKVGPRSAALLARNFDGALTLTESAAMLEYIADKYELDDLFPRDDLALRADISAYLHFHHLHTRPIHAVLTKPLLLAALLGKGSLDKAAFEAGVQKAKGVVQWYEEKLAQRALSAEMGDVEGDVFLVDDVPTIADIQAFTEVITYDAVPFGIGILPTLRADFPRTGRWLAAMAALPHYDDISNTQSTGHVAKAIADYTSKL